MKRLALVMGTIVGVAGLALSVSCPAIAADSAKDEITAVEHKLVAATSTEQFMEYVDEKEIVLYSFVLPLQYKGARAVRERTGRAFDVTDLKVEFVDLDVVADATLGVARSIQRITWKDKDGKPREGTWRVTDVFHKVEGKWKLIHMHASVPIDPATEKGQMNLKQ